MPIIRIDLLEGRTDEQKMELVSSVTDAVCRSIQVSPESVKIILCDMKPIDYAIGGVTIKEQRSK